MKDLELLTIGMITDIFIEKQNDEQEQDDPTILAEQADFNNF